MLVNRAATEGERHAALAASERLRARLATPHASIPSDPLLDTSGRDWPDRARLRERVHDWAGGRLDSNSLADWAQEEVGKWLLPDVPASDPLSVEVEVLLQLSTLQLGVLQPARDGPALLEFLDTPEENTERGWQAWFRHLRGEPAPTLERSR